MELTDRSRQVLIDMKIARIISVLSQEHNLPLDVATDVYYSSKISQLIEEGVADLHCRSDRYLASEVWYDLHPEDIPQPS